MKNEDFRASPFFQYREHEHYAGRLFSWICGEVFFAIPEAFWCDKKHPWYLLGFWSIFLFYLSHTRRESSFSIEWNIDQTRTCQSGYLHELFCRTTSYGIHRTNQRHQSSEISYPMNRTWFILRSRIYNDPNWKLIDDNAGIVRSENSRNRCSVNVAINRGLRSKYYIMQPQLEAGE